MKNTNIVIVVGNLTGDAELKQTALQEYLTSSFQLP